MAFRDVTTKDLGPKAKKVQKAILGEAAMAVRLGVTSGDL